MTLECPVTLSAPCQHTWLWSLTPEWGEQQPSIALPINKIQVMNFEYKIKVLKRGKKTAHKQEKKFRDEPHTGDVCSSHYFYNMKLVYTCEFSLHQIYCRNFPLPHSYAKLFSKCKMYFFVTCFFMHFVCWVTS